MIVSNSGMNPKATRNNIDDGGGSLRLIWHRHDLRLHDNELYSDLTIDSPSISLFVFDPQYFQPTKSCISSSGASIDATDKNSKGDNYDYQTIWCGPYAAQALIEAVTCLRESIRSLGGELLIRSGDPTVIIPRIAWELGATEIVFSEEPGSYERRVSQKLKRQYYNYYDDASGVKLRTTIGYTLYHPDDLPRHPNEWDQLAHPKRQQKGGNKKKKKSHVNHSVAATPSSTCSSSSSSFVDVSPERFRGMNRIMGDFRKAAKSATGVRKLLETPPQCGLSLPRTITGLKDGAGSIPTLEELTNPLLKLIGMQQQSSTDKKPPTTLLGIDPATIQSVVQSAFEKRDIQNVDANNVRGEKNALDRLDFFVDNGYASTADRSLADVSNNNDSSRLSAHLALGTISPRTIYWKAKNHEKSSCDWMASHLEMRDFFLYTAFANDSRLYSPKGLPISSKKKKEGEIQWNSPLQHGNNNNNKHQHWIRWATGETQLPLVDAAMKELMATGHCSNRVRQNVASVLTKDLMIDWRIGAEWFQFLLEDHCVAANWGNWLYFSGVGPDPKNRHFRTVSQMKRYDKKGEYVQKWIPVLQQQVAVQNNKQNAEHLFRPWDFCVPGFESPIVDPKSQYTWQDTQLLESTGSLFGIDDIVKEAL